MAVTEDPNRLLSYLQQCLSSSKKPLGLFLGAGCPMAIRLDEEGRPPLIPDIAGITQFARDALTKESSFAPLLEQLDQHFSEDGRVDPTVEDMLTHIRALHAVAGNAAVRGLSAEQLDVLDKAICDVIQDVVDKELPSAETPYHSVASWVNAIRRESPVELFTTNYDLLAEEAFEDHRVPYFDGFAGVRKPFFDLRAMEEDALPARWARLWKLHGSINWYQVENGGVFRGTSKEADTSRRVIHPSHLKYQESRRMPYLAMIDRLRAFLRQPTSALVLCGYSFRDEHLNEVLVQGLQSTQGAVAFALLYGNMETHPEAVALGKVCANLSILARDGAVISSQVSKWPEKDSESIPAGANVGLEWAKRNPDDGDGDMRIAQFTLGDFAVFGHFLKTLVGNVRRLPEASSAE